MFGPAEHEDLFETFLEKQLVKRFDLLIAILDHDDILLDILRSRTGFDADRDRVFQKFFRQIGDLARQSRRKEKRLSRFLKEREQVFHIMDEPHIEHPIDFIEHDRIERRKIEILPLDQVLQTTRCSDDEVRILLQTLDLRIDMRATDTDSRLDTESPRKITEFDIDLICQFTGRYDDQSLLGPTVQHLVQERNEESGGFTCSRASHTDHIALLEHDRNRPVLNRRRMNISATLDIRFDLRIDTEIHESMLRIE